MSSEKTEKIILIGKAACGKDYLADWLVREKNLTRAVSYTSRPMRKGEVNGSQYHFIDKSDFIRMEGQGKFYESEQFNTWYYGSTVKDFNDCNLFIKTPSGVTNLMKEDREKCFVVFLDIDEGIRRQRLMQRSDADTVDRRIAADEKDFTNFIDYDLRIVDEKFDPQMVYDLME